MDRIDLSRVYGEASREIKGGLRAIDILNFDAGKAEEIRRRTRRLTLALDLAAKGWTDTALVSAYAHGVARARVALRILGKKPRRQLMSKAIILRDEALETLVAANVSIRRTVDQMLEAALVGAQTARSARIQEFNRREILRRLAEMGEEAVATEISRGELGKKILDYLSGRVNDEGLIEVKGKFWDARKYAKLVARTGIRKSQTEATKDLCRQYENDLVEVSDHNTECEICMEIEGNVYSLSGKDPDYPEMPMEFPPHPQCQHNITPTSREAIEVVSRRR